MLKRVSTLLLCMVAFWASAEITLVNGGRTDYVIVLPEKPGKMEMDAVSDMQQILKKSTNADFKIVSFAEAAQYKKRIFIGSPASKNAENPLKNEERVYHNSGDDIFIRGGGDCGTTFAVYQFLMDVIGFRALHFWGDTIIPKHEKLVFKELSYDRRPSYIYRDLLEASWNLAGCPTSTLAFRRMMMHGYGFNSIRAIVGGCHTFSGFIPQGYAMPQRCAAFPPFKDNAYFKTNPEFFGMDRQGRRTDKLALCFSNPELRRTMTANVETYIKFRKADSRSTNLMVDIGQDDIGGKFCYCPKCAESEKKYKSPGGAFYDYLLNEASPYFAKKYPNMLIRFLVYGGGEQTEIPPAAEMLKNGRLPDNLVPFLAYIGGDFSKPWSDPANREIYEKLCAWGKISKNMFVYYYPTTFARPLVSVHMFGNVLRTAQDYKEGAHLNIQYVYNDYSVDFFMVNAGFYGLQHYLMARLSNDASLKVDALVKEYTDAIYGAAGAMIREYFYELEKLGMRDKGFLQWNPDPRFAEYFTPANLIRWQQDYDRMEQLVAKDPNALAHLRCSRINLDLMTLLLWNEIQLSGIGNSLNCDKIFDRFMNAAEYALKKCFQADYPNHVSRADKVYYANVIRTRLIDTGRYFYRIAKGSKPLPPEFKSVPKEKIRFVVPAANKEIISFAEDAAFCVTLTGKAPKSGTVSYTIVDPEKKYPGINRRVKVVDDGPYKLYYIGRTKLSRLSQVITPAMPYYTQKRVGGMAGYACAFFGHLYDPQNPDQRWDVYVSCRFKNERVYTDRFVLVKVTDPKSPPVIDNDMPRIPKAQIIVNRVPDVGGAADQIDWEKIKPLSSWKENLSGMPEGVPPEMKIAFDSRNMYFRFVEKNSRPNQFRELWDNCVDMILFGDALYPMLQIGVALDGKVLANTYNVRKSSNDSADEVTPEPVAVPGKFTSSFTNGTWTWTAAIPLDKLPVFKKGTLRANFYRTYGDGRLSLAWSPLYTSSYRGNPDRFGSLHINGLTIESDAIHAKDRTPDGIAFMDGNRGWELYASIPEELDMTAKYRIYAELRSDAETTSEKLTSRFGVFDTAQNKIIGILHFDVSQIRGRQFVRLPISAPVTLTKKSIIYIGGFIPAKKYRGNVYVRRFIIEKVQ